MAITAMEVIGKTKDELSKLTGLEPVSVFGVSKNKAGWHISIEMVEKHSIPDGMDILGMYSVLVDDGGQILEFNRQKLRRRVDTYEVEDETKDTM